MPLSQKGQTTFEYVFVMFVVVMMGGGILYQFNDAFRQFLAGYVGDYLACLLESGELPNLGFEDVGICQQEFQPFSLAKGRPKWKDTGGPGYAGGGADHHYTDGGPYSSGKSGGAGGGPGNTPGGNDDGGSNRGKFSDTSSGAPKGAESQPSGMQKLPGVTYDVRFAGGDGSGKTRSVALSNEDPPGKNKGRAGTSGNSLTEDLAKAEKKSANGIPLTSLDGKKEGEDSIKGSGLALTEQEAKNLGRRVPADFSRIKRDGLGDNSSPSLTFADFLKYLLIAGIIIALIVFLGTQALRISKSREK